MSDSAAYLPFLGLDMPHRDPATARVSLLPVPYDLTSTWQKGADRGPAALLDASQEVELYDIGTKSEPWRHGIATLAPIVCNDGPERLAERVGDAVDAILTRQPQPSLPVVLGGEHSVSIGAIKAAAGRFENLSVLQIDAHGDTRDSYEGSTHNHACVMARAREYCETTVAVGIRAIDASEVEALDAGHTFFAQDIVGNPDRSWIDRVVETLTDDVYLTIDLDAFDPSIIPATGTPEPGGLGWYDVQALLAAVTARRRVVAFDVVELMPIPGHRASEFAAAKLVYQIIAMILKND